MPGPAPNTPLADLLTLTLIPGLGPVLIARALSALGSADAVLSATPERLRTINGIGAERARLFREHRADAAKGAAVELARAADLGVSVLAYTNPAYPPLLREMADAPPILYVRGTLDPAGADRYPVAIVGSRECTHYGMEQSGRFATGLAQAGLSIVSGGARGIDTAAHRAAKMAGGRTLIVLGSGVNMPYPPENAEFFAEVAGGSGGGGGGGGCGAIMSELPLDTPPAMENFPNRNRIIAGLSLGVIVIEAGKRSGALITARLCAEDLGREVFAIPGRVDSKASEGALELIKSGGAHLVTSPGDVLELLKEPARHLHGGTHADRFLPLGGAGAPGLFEGGSGAGGGATDGAPTIEAKPDTADLRTAGLSARQQALLAALGQPLTIDELCRAMDAEPAALRADLTILELRRCVSREGSRVVRRS